MKDNCELRLSATIGGEVAAILGPAGFSVESERYTPESFGNAELCYRSGDVRVRILRDRGELSAELSIGLDPDEWWDVDVLLRALDASPASGALEELRQVVTLWPAFQRACEADKEGFLNRLSSIERERLPGFLRS